MYRNLIHVFQELRPCGALGMLQEMIPRLPEYQHTVVYPELPENDLALETVIQLQGMGINVLQTPLDAEHLSQLRASGYVFYNYSGSNDNQKLPAPAIYYSCGKIDQSFSYAARIACSTFVRDKYDLDGVIPPFINSRQYRTTRGHNPVFTLGILSAGHPYPEELVRYLLGSDKLPDDMGVMLSQPPAKFRSCGTQLAIDSFLERRNKKNVAICPVRLQTLPHYLLACHLLVYGTADHYEVPYSRTIAEAMALGVPVICPRSGFLTQTFTHGREVAFYEHPQEVPPLIQRIRTDPAVTKQLAANGQLWASWQDTTLHINTVRDLLKKVGI